MVEPDRGYFRMEDVAAGHNVSLHAGLRAQHTGHVLGLSTRQCGGSFVPMLGNPAAAGHLIISLSLSSVSAVLNARCAHKHYVRRNTMHAETLRGTLERPP